MVRTAFVLAAFALMICAASISAMPVDKAESAPHGGSLRHVPLKEVLAPTGGQCLSQGRVGICKDTSTCSGGTVVRGLCSGSASIACCITPTGPVTPITTPCTANNLQGSCMDSSKCTGNIYNGLCPGSSNIGCCVQPPADPVPSNICYPTLASHMNGKTGLCVSSSSACTTGTIFQGLCSDSQVCCVLNPGLPVSPNRPVTHGVSVDVAVPISKSQAGCLIGNGIQTVIVRGSRSTGYVDKNACPNLKILANQFGAVAKFDVYAFLCARCSLSGSQQLRNLVSMISSDVDCNAAFSGRIWLDIEQKAGYWMTSTAANRAWYQGNYLSLHRMIYFLLLSHEYKTNVHACTPELIDACGTYNVDCGIYSSWTMWQDIFGSKTFSYNAQFPLWNAHVSFDRSTR